MGNQPLPLGGGRRGLTGLRITQQTGSTTSNFLPPCRRVASTGKICLTMVKNQKNLPASNPDFFRPKMPGKAAKTALALAIVALLPACSLSFSHVRGFWNGPLAHGTRQSPSCGGVSHTSHSLFGRAFLEENSHTHSLPRRQSANSIRLPM